MRDIDLFRDLVREMVLESRDSMQVDFFNKGKQTDLIASLDKFGIKRIDVPGKNVPLGPLKPMFIKERGGKKLLMIPTASEIADQRQKLDLIKSSKSREAKNAISKSLRYTKDEFARLLEGYEFLSKECSQESIDHVFKKFNNEQISLFTQYDSAFNVLGPPRGVPPSFLKAFCLKESTLGTEPTAGRSPLFSIDRPTFSELQKKIENYSPTFESMIAEPTVEIKVAATFISRGISLIKAGGAEDIETALKKYRGIGYEPRYGKIIEGFRILIEALQT